MLPQLDPTWYASQSLWMLITFCAMFLVIWKFVMPAMRATVDERQSRLETDISATEKLKAEADRLSKEYQAALASASAESKIMLNRVSQEFEESQKKAESEFEQKISAQIANGEQALAQAKAEALKSVREISSSLAGEMVQKLTGLTITKAEIDTALKSVMDKNT